jgi:hypothetical protein
MAESGEAELKLNWKTSRSLDAANVPSDMRK